MTTAGQIYCGMNLKNMTPHFKEFDKVLDDVEDFQKSTDKLAENLSHQSRRVTVAKNILSHLQSQEYAVTGDSAQRSTLDRAGKNLVSNSHQLIVRTAALVMILIT